MNPLHSRHHYISPSSPQTLTPTQPQSMADASPKFHTPDLLSPPATTTTAAAPVAEISSAHDGLEFWQFMIAGSLAGIIEHTAMFPVDTLKTRTQAQRTSGLRSLLSSILRSEGPLGLYRGIAAMSLGAGPAHAVYFSVYELSKSFLARRNPNPSYSPFVHAASGVAATVASDAVFTPMDTVKQRLQLKSSPYRGVCDCVGRVLREEGTRAFFASYRTTVVMNAPFTAVHFATYEAAKRGMMGMGAGDEEEEGLVVHATAGAAAGALAAAVTTPLDVVKTQLQCQGVCGCDKFSSTSIREVIQTIVRRDGYVGLMRGWKPRMLFHAPAAAICWSTYEASKSFLQGLK